MEIISINRMLVVVKGPGCKIFEPRSLVEGSENIIFTAFDVLTWAVITVCQMVFLVRCNTHIVLTSKPESWLIACLHNFHSPFIPILCILSNCHVLTRGFGAKFYGAAALSDTNKQNPHTRFHLFYIHLHSWRRKASFPLASAFQCQ